MKRYKFISFIIVLLIGVFSCNPYKNIGGTFHFKLKGTLNNINETISLGDTLKFDVKMPSSITATTIDGATRTEAVNSLQTAFYVFSIFRIDTVNRTVYTNDSTKIKFIISPGYQTNGCPTCFTGSAYLQKTAPYNCVLSLIPQVKGIFYLEIIPQEGNFKVNNNFEGLFKVDFNVSDKHANIIAPFLTSWEQVVAERGNQGFGIYCFRVN